MPKEYARNIRVADLIQREFAKILERERISQTSALTTVSNVDVSPDLKNAKIYVTCLGDVEHKSLINDLQEDAGHYRHLLSKQLNIRVTPKLTFKYDEQLEQANRLTSIIDKLSDDSSEQD